MEGSRLSENDGPGPRQAKEGQVAEQRGFILPTGALCKEGNDNLYE